MDSIAQWLHLAAAVVTLGGTFFQRVVLLGAVDEGVGESARPALGAAIASRFKPVVHGGIAALLVTGIYNYAKHARRGDPVYLGLLHGKILLALGLFAISIGLLTGGSRFAKMRAERPKWQAIAIVLGVAILAISAFLRRAFSP